MHSHKSVLHLSLQNHHKAVNRRQARKLRYICLRQSSAWSETHESVAFHEPNANKLLASGAESDIEDMTFTEDKLLHLFNHLKSGKARYTWVHWARRVAMAHLDSKSRLQTYGSSQPASYEESVEGKEGSVIHHAISSPSDTIMTVQFVHTLSTLRILVAITSIMLTSALGALLWIFLGVGSEWMGDFGLQSASRVGSGMVVGVLVLLLELLVFGVWVWRS